ncbi:MAG: hypothetical protein JXB32_11915 [Deltaproteobacteria bacterium]|nr:hypothetical protein [Deltaproteobacteria bacterium]
MAPRKIPSGIAFDEAEDEILFTKAALRADPDAADLLPITEEWMNLVTTARSSWIEARQMLVNTDAERVVANHRLDRACTAFGIDLFQAVQRDTSSRRWTKFLDRAVSRFVRMPLGQQVNRVKAWLRETDDDVLQGHREELTQWVTKASTALEATAGTAGVRGKAWIVRDDLGDGLTAARDGLHETLAARARERGMGRDWPDVFFRRSPRRISGETGEQPETEPGASPAPTPPTP